MLYEELVGLEERVAKIAKKIKLLCKNNEVCQRILAILCIGELTATATVFATSKTSMYSNWTCSINVSSSRVIEQKSPEKSQVDLCLSRDGA